MTPYLCGVLIVLIVPMLTKSLPYTLGQDEVLQAKSGSGNITGA